MLHPEGTYPPPPPDCYRAATCGCFLLLSESVPQQAAGKNVASTPTTPNCKAGRRSQKKAVFMGKFLTQVPAAYQPHPLYQ